MNGKRIWLLVLSLMVALTLVGSAVGAIAAPAAPQGVITPVANPNDRASSATGALYPVNFMNELAVAADGRGTTYSLANYGILDLQYVIDQGTTPNTVTLTIQYSNDGVNWSDGANLVASNAADADDMIQLNNYGRYTNVYANVSNTETITVSVIAVAK